MMMIIIIIRLSSLAGFPSHILSSPFAVSVRTLQSPITSLHIFLSLSCSFLFVTGLWLSCSSRCFLPPREGQNVRTDCQKYRIFMSWKTPRTFCASNRVLRRTGTELLKKKPILSQEIRDEWESCVCNLFCINAYVGAYAMHSVHFNTKIVPGPVHIFKIRVSVSANSDKKSQGCLHAIVHASAFSHARALHHLADGINMCGRLCRCRGLCAVVVLVSKIGFYSCSFA